MGNWYFLLSIFSVWGLVKKSVTVPIPLCISYMWNLGSLLGANLLIQIVSGMMLAFNYEASTDCSFSSVIHIYHDVPGGWLFRFIHANGASLFFGIMYLHIGRSMYYGGYNNNLTWVVGISILLVSIGTAFLGYVLPWGQMSLWGATVITNLLSAVPYLGVEMTVWLWGGFSVGSPTLIRFFSLHFILPFVVLGLVVVHMIALHEFGSSNTLGVSEQSDNVTFHPYFTLNDVLGLVVFLGLLWVLVVVIPDVFMDPDNSSLANPMVTPPHIQPEWYFLFAYAILRSVPSNLGGVVGLVISIVIFYFAVMNCSPGVRFNLGEKLLIVVLFSTFLILTWIGTMPASYPFVFLGNIMSVLYFSVVILWLVF